MSPRGSLVPARFLVLTAHLVLLLQLGWGRDPHVRASLPLAFSPEEYAHAERLLGGALGGALGLLGVEFVGFFSGVSMFHPGQSLLSLGAHGAAALASGLALLEAWPGGSFWLLFGLCSVPPAATELLLLGSALGCREESALSPRGGGGGLGPPPGPPRGSPISADPPPGVPDIR